MNQNYPIINWEKAAQRYKEDYIDGQNRCKRCNKPLSNPMDEYGWKCAEILGVNQHNPIAEHFFSNPRGLPAKPQMGILDNTTQNTYNKGVNNFISRQNDLREKEIALKRLFFPTKPVTSITERDMEKITKTILPVPLGKDKDGEFIYEEYDPRVFLPSVKKAAAAAEHIYGKIPLTVTPRRFETEQRFNERSAENKDSRITKIELPGKDNDYIPGWRLIDVWEGREGMKMGFYIEDGDDWLNPSEYFVVFKGSSGFFEKPMDWVNNAERHFTSKSADMWDAINCARGFSEYAGGKKITFIGHSKGGAEAAAAAVATNRDAILFNPADANLKDYGLDGSNYTGNMVQYVVESEVLAWTGIGPVSPARIPTIRTAIIKQQVYNKDTIKQMVGNHHMPAVIQGLK